MDIFEWTRQLRDFMQSLGAPEQDYTEIEGVMTANYGTLVRFIRDNDSARKSFECVLRSVRARTSGADDADAAAALRALLRGRGRGGTFGSPDPSAHDGAPSSSRAWAPPASTFAPVCSGRAAASTASSLARAVAAHGLPGIDELPALAEGVTTLAVRNIPEAYTQDALLEEWPLDSTRDYVHLPAGHGAEGGTRVATVNFTSREHAVLFAARWHGRTLPLDPSRALSVEAASVQGWQANLQLAR